MEHLHACSLWLSGCNFYSVLQSDLCLYRLVPSPRETKRIFLTHVVVRNGITGHIRYKVTIDPCMRGKYAFCSLSRTWKSSEANYIRGKKMGREGWRTHRVGWWPSRLAGCPLAHHLFSGFNLEPKRCS